MIGFDDHHIRFVSFISDGGGDSSWTHATHVTGDRVLEQGTYAYDKNSNLLLSSLSQRHHDAVTDTGALTAGNSRTYYSAAYYDRLNRLTHEVNVGTNGSAAYIRPASPAARSDTNLVTSYSYDPSTGWLNEIAGHFKGVGSL